MSYCINCGEKINEMKFCTSCGERNIKHSNDDIEENKNIVESRDIEKYLNHLKKLVESESSLIMKEDIITYQKSLLSLSEEKFNNLSYIKFLGLEKVKDINSYLEIDQTFADQQLQRFYSNEKLKESDSDNQTKKWYKKWWGILIIVILVLGIIQGIFTAKLDPCECSRLNMLKSMDLYHDVEKFNNCLRKYGNAGQMTIKCATKGLRSKNNSKQSENNPKQKENIIPKKNINKIEKVSEKPKDDFVVNNLFRVIAPRGLNFRDNPLEQGESKILGKFDFDELLKLEEKKHL